MRLQKSHSDAAKRTTAGTAGEDKARRRAMRRGWGPFSGGQLTVIVVTVAVLLLLPVGAWAAYTVSHVTITDNAGVNTANVDAGHHLLVGDGVGSLTVDGTVSGRPLPPTSPFQFNENIQAIDTFVIGPAPLSTAINLTSLTISVPASQTGDIQIRGWVQPGTATTCTNSGFNVSIWHATNITGNLTVSFPTPLQTRPPVGSRMCLLVRSPSATPSPIVVNGSGFFSN